MLPKSVLVSALIILFCVESARAAETYELRGYLANTKGRPTYAGEVPVFLCDAKTGYPMDRETRAPAKFTLHDWPLERAWHTLTKENGTYTFADVPPGRYRLVAQSWSGTKGIPKLPGKTTSMFILLHGTAEDVEVKAGEPTIAVVRQLGNHTLHITNDPEEAAAFLLISLKPPIGDAILGPFGWGDEFVRNVVGFTHMAQPEVTILGLPENRNAYAGLVNYDNNPGVGAGFFKPEDAEGTVRIVASWSNGHHDPPPELIQLTEHIESRKILAAEFFDKSETFKYDFQARHKLVQQLRENPNRKVSVRDLGERRLAEVVAALSYAELRAQMKNRASRATQ
jgi:hypothetical protein